MRDYIASPSKLSVCFTFWFDASEKAGFDQLAVCRSALGPKGVYSPLMDTQAGSAILWGAYRSLALAGKHLLLTVGDTPIDVLFTGTDPLPRADICHQITDASNGLARAEAAGVSGILLSTVSVGCAARIAVTGGDAAPLLRLETTPPLNSAQGFDAYIPLTDANTYTFIDPWSSADCWYTTCLRNSGTGATSKPSEPFQNTALRAVPFGNLVRGWVRIVDIQGRPVANKSVMVSTQDTVHLLTTNGLLVDTDDQQLVTDSEGYCSTLFLRGVRITVGIAGTTLVRDVTPPTDPSITEFNLLDSKYGVDDAFVVQVPYINLTQRVEQP